MLWISIAGAGIGEPATFGLVEYNKLFWVQQNPACLAKPFPVNALRTCGLRWKFNLHVHLHVTHQKHFKGLFEVCRVFQSFLWKLFKHFWGFHGTLYLAKTKHSRYWTLTYHTPPIFYLFVSFCFWERVSLCNPDWSETYEVSQAEFELTEILLLHSQKNCEYRH